MLGEKDRKARHHEQARVKVRGPQMRRRPDNVTAAPRAVSSASSASSMALLARS